MLAKPYQFADGRRVTKTLKAGSRPAEAGSEPGGGTASAKRRQGSDQAAGSLASSQRLIQPRKKLIDVEADRLTSLRRQYREVRIGERLSVPPGSSIKIVARSQRSVENERGLPGWETHAPRTRETSPLSLPGNPQGVDVQLKEDIKVGGEESDSPIVLRDGRADHMGKGRAEKQREQSTHGGIGLIPAFRVKLPACNREPVRPRCGRRWFHVRVSLRSPVRENRTPGSARGAPGNGRPYLYRRFFATLQ